MKKFIRTGKKTLAVFMAALMVMTAWVFVEPLTASAATAGSYYVLISYKIVTAGACDAYSGYGNKPDNMLGISIGYKANNGTDSTEKYYDIDLKSTSNSEGTYTTDATVAGFPTLIYMAIDNDNAFNAQKAQITKVQIGSSSSNLTTIWTGTLQVTSRTNPYAASIAFNSSSATSPTTKKNYYNSDSDTYVSTTSANWSAPTATTVSFLSGVTSITIPKTGASDYSTSYTAGVYDQYGVRMTYEPTYYVRSTAPTSAQTSSSDITGVTMTSGTSSGTLKVTSAAQMQSGDSKSVYVHAVYGTKYANRTVTLNDPTYTFTFYNTHGGTPSPSANTTSSKKYYNTYGSTPSGTRTGFTFKGYYRDSDVADSYETDNTSGKTQLTSSTPYDGDYKWYAAWQANQYTATFKYYDSSYTLQTVTQTDYYGRTLNFPSVPATVDKDDYRYTYTGWDPADTTMQASNKTYTAVQTATFVKADLTELQAQIAAANAAIASTTWTDGGYTTASMNTVQNALSIANSLNKDTTGRTQQDAVDTAASNLKAAIAALELNTYSVTFYNADGTIIKVQAVEYGKDATAPANPAKNDDETYHYTFKAWDTAFTNVKSNLDVKPTYTSAEHTWGTPVTEAANCLHGSGTTKTCTVCGRVSATYDDTLGSHVKSASYAVDTQPTCTATGTGHYYCTVCGTSLDTVTIPAKGHSYTVNVTKAATCTTTGTREIKCSVCGLTTTETIPLVQHDYAQVGDTVTATCAHGSYRTMKCNNCTSTYKEYLSDPVAHDWQITVTPGSAGVNGKVEFKCSKCGETYTKEIPYNGHNYETAELTTAPTCVTPGVITVSCTDPGCTSTYTASVPATGEHVLTTTITLATCTAEGSIVEKCKNCTYSKTTTIPKAQHNYEKVAAESVSANCAHGAYDVMKCSVCGDTYKKYVSDPTTTHDWSFTTTAASAHKDGTVAGICNICGAAFSTTVPYDGHNYTVVKSITEPDCVNKGKVTIACSDASCTASYDVEIPATGVHDYEMTYVAPTCTAEGSVTNTCSVCGDTVTQTVPKSQHNFVVDTTVDATCAQSGYKVMKCSNAGCTETYNEYFGDATKAHTWKFETTPSGTNGYVTLTGTCEVCGTTFTTDVPEGHNFTDVVITKQPTCSATGTATINCTDSGCAETYTITLPENPDAHNYETTSVTADCQTVGSVVTKCADCGNVLSSVTFDKTPHAYENKGHINATCAEGGYDILTCSVCGETIKSYTDRPTTNHDWDITTTDASAHQDGTVSGTCKICGATFNATVPYDGHNYTKYEVTTEPTCQADGVVTISCSDPDCTESYTVTIPKTKSHVYGAADVQDATCTAEGYIRYTCLDCGYVDEHTLPLVQHVYEIQSTVPANCQHGAYNVMKCANCDSTYNEYLGNATTAHTWNITSTASSTHGYDIVTGTCEVCGATFTKEIEEGHSFSVSEVTKEPTCTVDGEVTISCSDADCTASYTVAVPATGVHDYETIYTAATCSTEGTIVNHCNSCGKEVTVETIPQLTHAYNYVRTEPTCTADGTLVQTCALCGDEITTVLPATGHKTVILPAVAATCNTTGLTAGEKCGVCGEVLVPQQVTEKTSHEFTGEVKIIDATCTTDGAKLTKCIHCDAWDIETLPATDHKYENADAVTVVAPTCYTKGYTEHKCDNCGYTYRDNYTDELVHNYIVEDSECIAPTCESIGTEVSYCEYCGAQKVITVAKTGHDWNYAADEDWEVTQPATCTGYGIETRICKNDATHIETRTIDPIGHKYNDVRTEPTCTEAGSIVSTCERCGDVNITILPALGHDYELVESHDQTCENGAYTKEICARCGDVLYTYDDSKPALGHNWDEWVVVREATCGEDGLMMRTCLNNPEHNEVQYIPATGEHNWVQTVVEPTCTESGFTIYACAGCGTAYRADFIPALEHDFDDGVYEEATCTTPGGTRYTCQRENCGYSYLVEDTPALGHDMGEWYMTAHPTEPDAYAKKRDCNRDGCIYYEYELGEDDSVNVYYKVDYFNDWIAKDGDEGHFTAVDGTVLAKEDADAYVTEQLESIYVLKGEAAVYPSNINPKREKTLSFGKYWFTGWSVDQDGASLDSVTKNITAHAQFEGMDEYYYVIFANENGQQITKVEFILHGHSAEYDRYFAPPTKESDLHYNYEFAYWTRDINGQGTPNSYSEIYSDGTFRAIYNRIPKQYKVVFHDWNGDVLGSELFEYGGAVNAPTDLSRTADATYIYEFTGTWVRSNGQVADMNNLTVPDTTWQEYDPANEDNEDLTDAQKGILHVTAKYAQKAKLYRVTIAAVDADGKPVPGASVQVLNPSGYLVTTATLDENSEVVLTLNYDTFYTIQVTYDGDVSETQITLDERNLGTNWPTVRVQLSSPSDIDPDHSDNCSCICHSFLGRIWITFLNLIYRLFGKKIVCCYDMYATHGDLLVYTS
ncbi:MAG: hypothetical protein ACI4W6_03535 [Acutalibacteraceae bacterium]